MFFHCFSNVISMFFQCFLIYSKIINYKAKEDKDKEAAALTPYTPMTVDSAPGLKHLLHQGKVYPDAYLPILRPEHAKLNPGNYLH